MVSQLVKIAKPHSPIRIILPYFLFALVVTGLSVSTLYSYLFFHGLIEAVCIIVILAVFALAWNSRKLLDNHYILFLGISFLSSAAFQLVHMFAFKGFGIFPGNDANLPTQLWIAFRYVFSLSFLIAPAFTTRRINVAATITAFTVITVALFVAIFFGLFPDCYIEGEGLTPFKVFSEYIIIVILLAALGLLLRKRHLFDPFVLRMLAFSIISAAAADAAFSQYQNVYGQVNLIGHLCLFLSAVLLYRAIVVTGIERPMALIFRNLEKSEERFRLIAETSVDLIFQLDVAGKVVFCSQAVVRYGYNVADVIGKDFSTYIAADDFEPALSAFKRVISGERINSLELRLLSADGKFYHVEINIVPMSVNDSIVGLQGISRDVTDRKQNEEQIKASLAEKEVMLREIHHRVKNNLQVISSLVSLQADSLTDDRIRQELNEVRDRIRSMALVHEKLYQSSNLQQLNFAEYTASLLHYLWRSHGSLAEKVRLNLVVAPVVLPIEVAVPCGLILNELAGNALKHAFPGNVGGEITVGLDYDSANGAIRLRVHDNGVGLPAGLDWRQSSSLGLRLVQILAGQLHGTVATGADPGCEFAVTFPLREFQA